MIPSRTIGSQIGTSQELFRAVPGRFRRKRTGPKRIQTTRYL